MREITYLQAISDAISHEMERDPEVLVLGEDVGGDFGGAFKVTKGLAARFGDRRVLNTPIAELSFIGMATGMALMGLRPIIEMQFADFISTGFDSIVQSAATIHYRFGGAVPWVIRAPSDGGIRSGPFHSQNPEAWFVHTPGLKVVAPSNPADADPNPVIYFEAKPLYRSLRGPVPTGEHLVPIGEARVVREGRHLTIVSYGAQVSQALTAAETLPRRESRRRWWTCVPSSPSTSPPWPRAWPAPPGRWWCTLPTGWPAWAPRSPLASQKSASSGWTPPSPGWAASTHPSPSALPWWRGRARQGENFATIALLVHRSGRGPMEGSIKAYGRAVPGLLR